MIWILNRLISNLLLVTLSPDTGIEGVIGSAVAGGAPTSGESPKSESPTEGGKPTESQGPKELPKAFMQLSPERLTKYKEKLTEEYHEKGWGEVVDDLYSLKEKMGKAIFIPDKETGTEEEAREFLKAIGVPDSKDGYKLDPGEFKSNEEFDKTFRSLAEQNGLTNRQAQGLYSYLLGVAKKQTDILNEVKAEQKNGFEDRLLKAVGDEDKKKETLNLYKKFLARLQDETVLKTIEVSGLLYSEDFAMAVAKIERAAGDAPIIHGGSQPGKEEGKKVLQYGKEFKERYGDGNP